MPLPPGVKSIGSKWIFNMKFQANGSIEQYKPHLVAKGFTPIPSKDYNAIFTPVVKLTIVRLLISLAASNSWLLHQLNVKNAFLNGVLDETVYMNPPPDFGLRGSIWGKFVIYKSLFTTLNNPLVRGSAVSVV